MRWRRVLMDQRVLYRGLRHVLSLWSVRGRHLDVRVDVDRCSRRGILRWLWMEPWLVVLPLSVDEALGTTVATALAESPILHFWNAVAVRVWVKHLA